MQKFENNGIFNLAQSEDLPHSSGIKTIPNMYKRYWIRVGRLAPLIGD